METRPPRRVDPVGAFMVVATVLALAGTAWLRYGPIPTAGPPKVGATPPPLRLLDPVTAEPMVLIGLRGKVVWVSFWSAGTRSGRADLAELDEVWDRLKARPGFAMAAVAVEADRPERVRAARSATRANVPVYLASTETIRAFGAVGGDLPLHILIDDEGRVAAVVRGRGRVILDRLARQAEGLLDALQPLGNTRFAESIHSELGSGSGAIVSQALWHRGVRAVPRRPGVGSRRGRRQS
jgi:hypothetical protein